MTNDGSDNLQQREKCNSHLSPDLLNLVCATSTKSGLHAGNMNLNTRN